MTPEAAQILARLFDGHPLLARVRQREFDPSQPRDEDGKWTDGGGGGGSSGSSKPAPSNVDDKIEPHVVDVGGDEWNQKTALKLERDYQSAKPAMEQHEQRAIGNVEEAGEGGDDEDDEDTVYMPEEWESLSGDDQAEAADAYIEHNKDDYYNSEVENWQQEYAGDEAMAKVAEDFNDGSEIEWAEEAINDVLDDRDDAGKPIPFDTKQLINALNIEYEAQGGSWPKKDPEITFDDDKLTKPAGYDPDQQTLPGIEPLEPHEMLSDDMREEIEKSLMKAFEKRSESVASDMDPPDYLMDSAKEMLGESWDQQDDSTKFEFVQNNTNILEKYEAAEGAITEMKIDALPKKYDPLNNTSGDDYRRTQALARYLSRERSKDVLEARNLEVPSDQELRRIDSELWRSWKESSTSDDGKLIQLATAEELGGRLNAETRGTIDPEKQKARAEKLYDSVGGYAGVKALIRAKWETTQYLLDKADMDELQLFRGLTLPALLVAKLFGHKHVEAGRKVGSFTHLPTMDVKRNGAASTTTALSVANGWGGGGSGKVVLRAVVPRTAAISIPAYGINVKSEQEVVIAGTAWKGWDVWQGQAPGFSSTPLQKHT